MNHQRLLLLKLPIKRDKKKIADAVEWNFGHCPQEKWFDDLIDSFSKDIVELDKLNKER